MSLVVGRRTRGLPLIRRGSFRSVAVVLSLLYVAGLAVLAIWGTDLAPYPPGQQDLALSAAPPGNGHLLGTDQLGRDILSRTMAGTALAVSGPLVLALTAAFLGSALGLCAGYFGGRIDGALMRWVDFMYALPGLLVTIVIVGVAGGGYWAAVALLTILTVPYDTRLIRSATLQERRLPYVEAAEALGVSRVRILVRHIWPNLFGVIIPNSCLNFVFVLSGLASLSFLGIGSPPGSEEWGRMVFENSRTLFINPWGVFAPALMLVATAVVFNFLGDYMYEKFSDRGSGR